MANIERIVFLSLILDLFGASNESLLKDEQHYRSSCLYYFAAFTIPLPLFPRIVEWYTKASEDPIGDDDGGYSCILQRESSNKHGLLSQTLQVVSVTRSFFVAGAKNSQKWDVVLLGERFSRYLDTQCLNCMLQVESWDPCSRMLSTKTKTHAGAETPVSRTLQFLVSPHIGSLSDKYGRKRVLLITMIGNIASALV
jgi:hypothetical protein